MVRSLAQFEVVFSLDIGLELATNRLGRMSLQPVTHHFPNAAQLSFRRIFHVNDLRTLVAIPRKR
jgi:hypothetical protein